MGMGQAALSQGRPRQAIAPLEEAETRSLGDPKIWYTLGSAYAALGNKKRAAYCRAASLALSNYVRDLGFAVELTQKKLGDPLLRLRLARLYAEGGQYPQAINPSAPKELAALTRRLKAQGQMPSMSAFDGMMIASVKLKPQ